MNPMKRTRTCVVLPTYNNARTLQQVIQSVRGIVRDIIVVDDGSKDGSTDVLEAIDGIEVIRHETNLGKGAALITGLDRAHDRGFAHAITMDTDGQHAASDLPGILSAIEAHPDALILGCRELRGGGRARKSRLLRANSNFWVWTETGQRVSDSQSGFRVYPLEAFSKIRFKTRRYDFEVEAIVLALWSGIPVRSVPVSAHYGPGSESQFRPIVDFIRVTRLNIRLIMERMALPKSIRQWVHQKAFYSGSRRQRWRRTARAFLLQESLTPASFSACIGVGVFCGIVPVWGFQTALALILAQRLGLSRALTVLASNVSMPAFMPIILYLSLLTGHVVLNAELDFTLSLDSMTLASTGTYALEYLVGSILFAGLAGVTAAYLSFGVSSRFLKMDGNTAD